MLKAVRRNRALLDIEDIADYLAQYNLLGAYQFFDAFEQTVEFLCELPMVGPVYMLQSRPELDIRFFPVRRYHRYAIYYHVLGTDTLEVLRVLHHARDVSTLLEREP